MDNKDLINKLYDFANEKMVEMYPDGWGCCCAVYTDKGNIYYSKYFDGISESVALCFETGAILEVYNKDEKITHSVSLIRNEDSDKVNVVVPCGVCQERLFTYGEDVNIAYTDDGSDELKVATLKELNPHHWFNLYRE